MSSTLLSERLGDPLLHQQHKLLDGYAICHLEPQYRLPETSGREESRRDLKSTWDPWTKKYSLSNRTACVRHRSTRSSLVRLIITSPKPLNPYFNSGEVPLHSTTVHTNKISVRSSVEDQCLSPLRRLRDKYPSPSPDPGNPTASRPQLAGLMFGAEDVSFSLASIRQGHGDLTSAVDAYTFSRKSPASRRSKYDPANQEDRQITDISTPQSWPTHQNTSYQSHTATTRSRCIHPLHSATPSTNCIYGQVPGHSLRHNHRDKHHKHPETKVYNGLYTG
ncbi:hypothetical protein GE09DRAFT_573984 [Coniochaeta sp. 2T2.1]|nr:hypothetical protein GE09DRAFT_573984 [Coniochaeta sp. 2T2.1]